MNVLLRSEPLAAFDSLLEELLHPTLPRAAAAPAARRVRVDVRETPEAYVVYAELPGVAREAIHVDVEANDVTIAADAAARPEAKEGEKWLHRERPEGRWERRFALPAELDSARAEAKFADGVLELTLPKKVPAGARKIAVH